MPLNSPELILLEIWSANQLLRTGCEGAVWIALPAYVNCTFYGCDGALQIHNFAASAL
jgi:hypothetical protein